MFLSCLLDDRIVSPTSVCLFLSRKILTTTEETVPELEGFHESLHDVTIHLENPDPFLHSHIVILVVEVGTLNLDLRALKFQNPIFFLEYHFTSYRATITIKALLVA